MLFAEFSYFFYDPTDVGSLILIGSAWGLIVKMDYCADHANKRRHHGDPWDWLHCSSDILFSPLALSFPRLCDHPTMEHLWLSQDYVTVRLQLQAKDKLTTPLQGTQFPSTGYKKDSTGFLLESQSLSFRFNKFPFLCLTARLVLFAALALQLGNLEGLNRH